MSDENFGQNYYTIERLMELYKNQEIFIFKDEKCLYGFIVAYKQKEFEFWETAHININGSDEIIGVLKSIYFDLKSILKNRVRIKPLFGVIREKFNDIKTFYSPVWKSKLGSNSKNLVESLGFVEIMEIKNYWDNIPEYKSVPCPVCGLPCTCSCVIYKKEIK